MYCVKCGIKLADTEKMCPLCSTLSGDFVQKEAFTGSLYPQNRYPEINVKKGALNGAILFLFCIPLFITFFIDLRSNDGLDWFWYTSGALALGYVVLALPVWFQKPNPVIFIPCDFAAAALYMLLINLLTDGMWFLYFALPVTVGVGLIVTTVITLMRYVRKGRLYIFGGAFIAMGVQLLVTEILLAETFAIRFVGWSIYPLIVLSALGGLLIFLAINSAFREKMERKFFF